MNTRLQAGDKVIFRPYGLAKSSGIPDGTPGVITAAAGDQYNWCEVDFCEYGTFGCWQVDLERATD